MLALTCVCISVLEGLTTEHRRLWTGFYSFLRPAALATRRQTKELLGSAKLNAPRRASCAGVPRRDSAVHTAAAC